MGRQWGSGGCCGVFYAFKGRELVMTESGVQRLIKAPEVDNVLPALLRQLVHLPSLGHGLAVAIYDFGGRNN